MNFSCAVPIPFSFFAFNTTMVYCFENFSSSLNKVEGLSRSFIFLTTGGLLRTLITGDDGRVHQSACNGPVKHL